MRFRYSNLSYGSIAYLVSLLGTVLLANDLSRPWALLPLIGAAVLAVLVWGRQEWIPAFSRYSISRISGCNHSRFYLVGVISAFLLVLAADFRYLAVPNETFGLAGILWLASIGLLLCAAFVGSQSAWDGTNEPYLTPWTTSEIVILAGLTVVALLTRIWDLTSFPDNIYPDEIMTGTIATQSYIGHTGPSPSVFSTVWICRTVAKTVWPVIRENLLGISTHSSQDIIFYAPLLIPAEAALLVLGVALLLWHWRHPAAFLMFISGLGVLLIGGILVSYPNSVPPLINHWTPAFPVFYVALAVPIGAWAVSAEAEWPIRLRWALPATFAIGLLLLGWFNLNFYFHSYYADPASLKSSAYRSAQQNYEIQTAQSRYRASLGPGYHVFTVGKRSPPYDPTTTRYLVADQEWTMLPNPAADLLSITAGSKGLAFLFFPGNEQYREFTHKLYPGGVDGEVTTKRGEHLFYTYVVAPKQV
jgi:hypothetical protein